MFVPTGGARGRGRPRRRYYDTIKADLQERGAIINARTQQEQNMQEEKKIKIALMRQL